jgi:hypothetical protein
MLGAIHPHSHIALAWFLIKRKDNLSCYGRCGSSVNIVTKLLAERPGFSSLRVQ